MMTIFLLVAGLTGLVLGGDLLVRGAERVAIRLGVSPLLVGLIIVGFGTSTPELVTSLQAAFMGSPGISVGNVVGSNIANILLILGVTAVIAVIPVDMQTFRRDAMVLLFSAGLAVLAVLFGQLTPVMGVFFIVCLIAYIAWSVMGETKGSTIGEAADIDTKDASSRQSVAFSLCLLAAGIGMTILGANFVVLGAIKLARSFGVSETIIGLTIVAVGTSLPEMVASVMAALRKQTAIAFGNVVGSNIFNILFILGVTAVVKPITVPPAIAAFDIWIMLLATLVLVLTAFLWKQINRGVGVALLTSYGAYNGWLILMAVKSST